MNPQIPLAMIVVPLVALAGAPSAPTANPAGCGTRNPAATPDAPEWLYVVDAEIVDTAMVDLDTLDIQAVQVICWKKAERMFGAHVRLGVVSVWTHRGPRTAMESALIGTAGAQEGYFERHGVFAGDVAALMPVPLPERITIEVKAEEHGWSATAQHEQVDYLCFVFGGSATPPHRELEKGKPGCFSQHRHSE